MVVAWQPQTHNSTGPAEFCHCLGGVPELPVLGLCSHNHLWKVEEKKALAEGGAFLSPSSCGRELWIPSCFCFGWRFKG